jgi:transglutaminase-like putative cysteine protease
VGLWRYSSGYSKYQLCSFQDDGTCEFLAFSSGAYERATGTYSVSGSEILVTYRTVNGKDVSEKANIPFVVAENGSTVTIFGIVLQRIPNADVASVLAHPFAPYPRGSEKPLFSSQMLKYYTLTPLERELYDEMAKGIVNFEDTVVFLRTYDKVTQEKVFWVLHATLPEVFWWSGEFSYFESSSGISYFRPIYAIDQARVYGYRTDAQLVKDRDWIAKGKEEIRSVLAEIPIRNGMTPYEIEITVHDWLCKRVKFELYEEKKQNRQTMYGALVGREANCVGYAKTLQYILYQRGIECLAIYGLNGEDLHFWNAVKLDGEWYNVDTSSNSRTMHHYGTESEYWLFNRTDEAMARWGFTVGASVYPKGVNPQITCTSTKHYNAALPGAA